MSTINVPDDEKTIQGAVNRAHDGDTVVVHGESEADPTVYEERVDFRYVGAANATLKAEPRRSASMFGFDTWGAGVNLTLEGFRTVAAGDDEIYLNYIASPNVTIRDFSIRNTPWAAIYVDPRNPDLPGGVIENCHAYGCGTGFHTTGVGWRVLNNNIERLINRLGKDADYVRGFGTDLLLKRNHFHGTVPEEVGSAHVDGFQTFDSGGRHMRGLQLIENIIEDCHQAVILADLDDPGDVENVLLRNNWFRNVWGTGVYVRNVVRNVRIEHNLFQNMGLKGVFVRWGAEVDVTANIFEDAGSNYHADSGSTLTGGYNILNRQGYPRYSVATDILDHDPLLDAEGYATSGLVTPAGLPIGRIRPDATDPEPEPKESEEGHEHSDYALMEHEHGPQAHLHNAQYSEIGHEHDMPVHMSNETRLMFEMLAQGDETLARQIRDRLGE